MKLLHSVACPWDEEALQAVARNGNLATLNWLHNTGCPRDELTFISGATSGNGLYVWGAELDWRTFDAAAGNGDFVCCIGCKVLDRHRTRQFTSGR